jgi:2-oxoglutarate ferredoxin oxidoreductase subunit beta
VLRLRKLAEDHDPTDRASVMNFIQRHNAKGEIVTGLLYVEPDSEDLHDRLGVTSRPLNSLGDADLCPGNAALDKINAGLR